MSKYTIELRQIKDLRNTIFNFDYNFISEEYKNKLETMFINHFYFREIGFETIERFNFYLRNIFTEKLEYYEILVNASMIEYDILNNYDLTENMNKNIISKNENNFTQSDNEINNSTNENKINSSNENSINENINSTSSINSTSTINEIKKYCDTPQNEINLNNNNSYLTNVTQNDNNNLNNSASSNTSSSSNTSKSTIINTENNKSSRNNNKNITGNNKNSGNQEEIYTLKRKGNIGVMTATDMLEKHIEYKKKVTNIINQFLEKECNCLFMQIY